MRKILGSLRNKWVLFSALALLLAGSAAAWFFWPHPRPNLQNSTVNDSFPTQAQRAAVVAAISQTQVQVPLQSGSPYSIAADNQGSSNPPQTPGPANTTFYPPSLLETPTADSILAVTNELKSGNAAQTDQALTQIRAWFSIAQVPRELYVYWVPALINHKRFQDAADISLAGALTRPDIRFISPLMALRAHALLDLGDTTQALQAAKSYFNVCYMRNTNTAIKLVALCLAACHPQEPQLVRLFRAQQRALAVNNANSPTPPAGNAQADAAAPVLQSVQIDASIYNDALQKWKAQTISSGKFFEFDDYANVLLAAGRADEALKIYENLYQQATFQDDLSVAIEGIARAMRDMDGTVFRARAWELKIAGQ
jgi:tetratricopeptide (TPR) repeat protein